MRVKPLLIATIPFALVLTGCGQERPAIAKPPVALLTCADEPAPPSLPGRDEQARRDALMLDYVLAFRTAWGDCHAKVAGVKAWADALGD